MSRAIAHFRDKGFSLAFLTYTVQHDIEDTLPTVRDLVLDAHKAMHSGKAWHTIERTYEWVGSIKAVEVLTGVNGWHFHLHEIAFVADDCDYEQLEATLTRRWSDCVASQGGLALPGVGLDITPANVAVKDYVGKWGIVPELVQGMAKIGRTGNVSPFQLPDLAVHRPDLTGQCIARFNEFATGIHGVKQIWASPSVRPFMAANRETFDRHPENDPAVAQLDLPTWRRIWRAGKRVQLLQAVEHNQLCEFLDNLELK